MTIATDGAEKEARPALIAAIVTIGLVGVGLTLSGPLISVRMEEAGFSAGANGWSMALAGLATLCVSPLAPRWVQALGVRRLTFAALALMFASLMGFALIGNIALWFPLRFLLSAALSILFILSEFVVSARAPPHRRGFWLGLYSTALGAGFLIGPATLSALGAGGARPFLIAMAFVALAGLPAVLYGAAPAQAAREAEAGRGALRAVPRAPALFAAAFAFGAVESSAMALLPVHALRNGFDAETGALFVAAIALGNILFQLPLGMAADRLSRRRVLAAICLSGCLGALALPALATMKGPFIVGLAVWGGLVSGLYMIALGELGARFAGADLVAANSGFVGCYALGMLTGPPALGAALDVAPAYGLFWGLATVFAIYGLCLAAIGVNRPGSD